MPRQLRKTLIDALISCGHDQGEASELVLAHEDRSRRDFVRRLNGELTRRHLYYHAGTSPKLVELGELNKVIDSVLKEPVGRDM